MTVYNDRIVIVFPIPERNGKPARPADASFQTLEVSDSGNEFINVVPLNPQAIGQYADQFSLDVIAERDSLKSQLEAKTQEASTLATERDSLRSQLAAANESLATKTSELAALNATIAEKDERIAKLLEEVPFDPRDIHLNAFKARLYKVLSPADLIRLYATDADPVLKQIAATIVGWEDKYPIKLDSRELREPLGYLLMVQLITEEEQAYLVSDSTRAEAFFPADQST
jgi:regulator of replication initiation timing